MSFPTKGFSLSPFVLNWVEVRRIRREIFQNKTGFLSSRLYILAFVKAHIIHHDDSPLRDFWQSVLGYPRITNIAIDIIFKGTNGG
nr:hypothetical protein [Candidatus Fukatsuia symbiotica]